MAFKSLSAGKTRTTRLDPNSVSVSLFSGGELSFFLPQTLMDKMGWNTDMRMDFQEGNDSDAGHFALTISETGASLRPRSRVKTDGAIFRVSMNKLEHHELTPSPLSGHRRIDATPVPTQAFGGRIVCLMPSWIIPKE